MKIYFATDHAGFELKEKLVPFVRDTLGYEVVDCGAYTLVSNDDYPKLIREASEAVSDDSENNKAIVFGGSGQGEAIVANKSKGARAVVYYGGDLEIVKLSREHNDANVLSLGARFINESEAQAAVTLWLKTKFSSDIRHVRRIAQIGEIEE